MDLGSRSRRWLAPAAAVLLVLIGCARISSTWKVFAQTFDENAHIACGLEWWTRGTYGSEVQHPPLARIAVGAGPYLLGQRWSGNWNMWAEGQRILENGDYLTNLAAARAGVLVFFLLACLCIYLWTCDLIGPWPAVCAVFLFTNIPPVLAHAGVATTDMACAAGFITAAYTTDRWLVRNTWGGAVLAGFGIATALMSKFSLVVFFGAALVPLVAIRWRSLTPRHAAALPLVAATVALLTAAVYHFQLHPQQPHPHPAVAAVVDTFGKGSLLSRIALNMKDAPAVIAGPTLGILEVASHGRRGHGAYLMGEIRITGWWYFFPFALGVKTQKAILALVFTGILALMWQRRMFTGASLPFWTAVAVLAVCMRSPINLGVRHALPMYPLMCILAAIGVAALWQVREKALTALLVVGLVWIGAQSAMAHPDYLAYFSVNSEEKPEDLLVDSDLDWGQDTLRLCEWVNQNHVNDLSVAVFTNADLTKLGCGKVRILRPYEQATGWVARSVTFEKLRTVEWAQPGRPDGAFDWLKAYKPVTRVGKSIDIFYIK